MKKIIFVILIIFVSCNDYIQEQKEAETLEKKFENKIYKLLTGSINGFGKSSFYVNPYFRYSGMVNKEVFSLSGGFNSSVNVYYPISSKIIIWRDKYIIKIIEVKPEYIKVKLIGIKNKNDLLSF